MHLTLRRGCAQLPHIRTPFFVSNSQFDSWSMGSILGAQAYISLCPADQKSYGDCSTNCKLLCAFVLQSAFQQTFLRRRFGVRAAVEGRCGRLGDRLPRQARSGPQHAPARNLREPERRRSALFLLWPCCAQFDLEFGLCAGRQTTATGTTTLTGPRRSRQRSGVCRWWRRCTSG